jgi:hypothetical protein
LLLLLGGQGDIRLYPLAQARVLDLRHLGQARPPCSKRKWAWCIR